MLKGVNIPWYVEEIGMCGYAAELGLQHVRVDTHRMLPLEGFTHSTLSNSETQHVAGVWTMLYNNAVPIMYPNQKSQ